VKVPVALADRFGTHLHVAAAVTFPHRGDEWAQRVAARQALRYDITFDSQRGRWYLDASWTITPPPVPELDVLRAGRVLGVDLNADHLAACALDSSGNPVGAPATISVDTAGLRASHRDGRVRAAITAPLDLAGQHNCAAIVVENLDFADAVPPEEKPWAVAVAANGCAAPSPEFPPGSFGTGSPTWRHAAASRSSELIRRTPASGGVSIGVNHYSNRLLIRPPSPRITVRPPRSADVDSASRSGVDRQDPAPTRG
jgi:hypothetical protein